MLQPTHTPPPDDDQPANDDAGYIMPNRYGKKLQPLHPGVRPEPNAETPRGQATAKPSEPSSPAVELIRRKIDELYQNEPAAAAEAQEAKAETPRARSKHQQFMYQLSTSGKPLAEIQAAWHAYYAGLPDREKHEVWQEFYAAHQRQPSAFTAAQTARAAAAEAAKTAQSVAPAAQPAGRELGINPNAPDKPGGAVVATLEEPAAPAQIKRGAKPKSGPASAPRTIASLKHQLQKRVRARAEAQRKAKQHLQSLFFGLGTGAVVLLIFLFGFFNEIIITPFIQPSRHAGATPIILSTDGVAPTAKNEVIIPKINVEIPVDYSLTTTDENAVENALEDGVVHYPSTVAPGQQGNTAFFGHSSNNIFNPGKYKFAFVLLHTLVPGDIFYLTYNGKVYTYQVYDKQIVDPGDVAVLNNVPGKLATATLITCDPPGTSLHRLVVWGQQVNPDPAGNAAPAQAPAASQPAQLASNGPSLWSRLIHWLF